jgi:predicted TIM-barrel fold metal-dependent hydrolase
VPADHPLYLALADRAAAHDVPIDLHMEAVPADMPMPANLRSACTQNPETLPASIPALHVLLDHNPRAKIVWQHVGWDNVGFMTPTLVRDLLEAHPNLYVALRVEERTLQVASSAPMPNRLVAASGAVDPDWLALIVAKPERFVIGSDEFVSPEGSPTNGIRSFARTWDLLEALPPEVQSQVGGDNARALYHLP